MRIIDKFLHKNFIPGVVYSGDITPSEFLLAPQWLKDVLLSEYTGGNIIAKFWEHIPDKKSLSEYEWLNFNVICGRTKIRLSFPIYDGFCPIANCEYIDPKLWYDDEKMWVSFTPIEIAGFKHVDFIDICPICDTTLSNIITSCGHQYCLHCILSWNNNCPICRTDKFDIYSTSINSS